MDSDVEDIKSQTTPSTAPTRKHKHKHKHKHKKNNKVESVQATIQVLPENPEKIPPVVAYFTSRFDPAKSPHANPTRIGFFRNTKPNRARSYQLVATPDGTKVDFVGTSYTGEAATPQTCNYGLGILDTSTQTLKIVPIVANKIFRLEPRVRGVDRDAEPASSVAGPITKQERAEKNVELQTLYGTKKAIRENKKLRLLKQGDNPDYQQDLEDQIKNTVVNEEALKVTEAQISRHIPSYDMSAKTPQEAYPLDKIISSAEWDSLRNIYDLWKSKEEVSWDTYPRFVCNRIKKLQIIQVEDEKFKRCCIFSYITHLIKFKDQHTMEGVSSAKGHKIPNILYNKFVAMFSSEAKRLSTEKTNLLISYVLVLTLFADDFKTDPTDIAKDLRMSSVTLRKHYENLGSKFSRHGNLMYATLSVPLQFQELGRKRQKRKA